MNKMIIRQEQKVLNKLIIELNDISKAYNIEIKRQKEKRYNATELDNYGRLVDAQNRINSLRELNSETLQCRKDLYAQRLILNVCSDDEKIITDSFFKTLA